ncbi:MAG: ABC transporter permease [Nitrospirae bacterium]|nr:ABC transporter permease [Nitrospirota bacterium]
MSREEITVYEPNSRHKIGLFKIWLIMIRNIISSRELIFQLFKKDFFAAYKKTFLGIGWILISPIIGIVSWVFMNAAGILRPGDVGIPYPAYVLLSSSIWGLFMGFYSASAGTLGAGAGFIMQVKYPHEVLLVQQVANQLANFLTSFILTIIVLVFFGVIPDWKIISFPFLVLPLFFLGAAIGLVVSVISAVTSEVQRGVDMLLGMLIYVTPVIYSPNIENPMLQTIIGYNPLTYLIGGARDIIIYGRMEHFDRFLYSALLSFVLFMFSWRLFYVSEDKVIEKMI